MDKYQQLGTVLLRCLTQNFENYRVLTCKEDNNFYLIFEKETEASIIEFNCATENSPLTKEDFLSDSGKFSLNTCLNTVNKLNVCGTVDYFICTNRRVVEDENLIEDLKNFILRPLYKVRCAETASVSVYVSEATALDIELELRVLCGRRDIELTDSRAVLNDYCSYLKDNVRLLTKKSVRETLLYLFLRQYKLELDFLGMGDCQFNSIWCDITSDKLLTVVDCSCVEFLKSHTVGAVVLKGKSKCDLKLYENLWYSNEVSLLLQVHNLSDFVNVLNILETFGLPLRVTVLSDCLAVPKLNSCFSALSDLNESQQKSLLDLDVNVQNRFNIKLGSILNETEKKSFKCADIIRALSIQSVGFQPLPEYYIERSFLRVILSLNVLEEVDEPFLVQNKAGSGNMLLKELVNKNLSHVRIVEENDFEVPATHFVNFYGENWVEWKKSLGAVTRLRPYDISARANVTCDLSALLAEERKTIVVSGSTGMGKSLVLNAVALALPNDCWIETIDCSKNSGDDLVRGYFAARKKVHVLIDGFNHESPEVLEKFHKLDYNLWVVTRPANTPMLENLLKTLPVQLAPFTPQNQHDFLTKYFQHQANTSDDAQEFANELLKVLKNVFADFVQNPLHLQILADYFVPDYKTHLITGVLDFDNQFRIIDVLEAFLNTRFDLLCGKYNSKNLRVFLEHYSLLALTVKFDKSDLKNLCIDDKMKQLRSDEMLRILASEDVIESETSSRLRYDVFNDYLAAKWICANLNDEDTVGVLLQRRFSDLKRFGGVFTLIDYILAENCPLHLHLIKGKTHQVQDESGSSEFFKRDRAGRTIAHIAALYGEHHPKVTNNVPIDIHDKMVPIISLSNEELITAEDYNQKYNPLDYALATGALAVANAICEKLPGLTTTVSLSLPELENYFEYCTRVNSYRYLYKNLLTHVLIQMTLQNKVTESFRDDNFVQALNFNEMIQDNISEYIQTLDVSLISHMLEALQLKTPDAHVYSNLNLACAYGTVDNVLSLLMDGAQINRLQLYTPLHCAVIHKRLDIINTLLSLGAKINSKDTAGNTPLHLACQTYCNNPIVEKLLQHNASPNLTNANGDTPLHVALQSDLPSIVRLFLPKNRHNLLLSLNNGQLQDTDINVQNNYGETPLLLAIKYKQTSLIHELLESYADVNLTNQTGNSCLHYAARNQDSDVLLKLIYSYIYVNALNEDGETPLLISLKAGKVNVAKILMAKGGDVNATDKDFTSCLHYAVLIGREQIVLDLLELGANIDRKNNVGITPLMHAIIKGRPSSGNLLINRGADVNLTDDLGWSALHYAAQYNQYHVAKALISHGTEVNLCNNEGETPFIIALKNTQATTAKTLLGKGADVSVRDKTGSTCLHLAASMSCPDIVVEILKSGIDVDTQDSEGNTPLLLALNQPNKCISRVLLLKGADISIKNRDGFSAIHCAAKHGLEDFIIEFIQMGANVNEKNAVGDTPLMVHVTYFSIRSTVKTLIDNGADVSAINAATGNSCLHYLVKGVEDDIISDMVAKGADINGQNNDGDTPLTCCIKDGYFSTVELLLSLGGDANIVDYRNGNAPLHWAITMREDDVVEALINNGADINKENNDGETPLSRAHRLGFHNIVRVMTDTDGKYESYKNLCEAVKRGRIFTVKKLLTDDFDIDRKNDNGDTLLMLALENGEVGIADYLLSRGASINLTNNRGASSLHLAASTGDVVMVRHHLDNGVDIDFMDINGDTPLIAALYAQSRHVTEFLMERQARIELTPVRNPKQTCMHFAIEAGMDNVVLEMLRRGFHIEKQSVRGSTPLLKALSYRNSHIATLLIERGANVNVQNESRATPLHLAATEGIYEMVDYLVKKGATINTCDSIIDTPFMNAIECDKDAIALFLLSQGADIHVKNFWGSYPLHLAASSGMDKIIPILLDRGFDINTETDNGDTALFVALSNCKIDTARLLLSRGAHVDHVKDYCTCLHLAIEAGYEELVRELLKNGQFSVTDMNSQNYTPLSLAMQNGHASIVKLLFQQILCLEHLDPNADYLHFAAEFGDFAIVSALLDRGMCVNQEDKEGETPLMIALRQRQWSVAELLMTRGADVTIRENEYGRSCLHHLACSAQDRLFQTALNKGAEVNAQQFDGATPLIEAIKENRYSIVKLLMAHGADPNIVDNDGYTALHYASRSTDKILQSVIDSIKDIDRRTNENETALLLAIQNSEYDLAMILLKHGASDLVGESGSTCLHHAAERGALDVFTWIADKFGNIDAVNSDGNTPIMLALMYEKEQILEELLKRGANTSIPNNDGFLCTHYAVSSPSNLALFINGDDLDKKTKSGATPLWLALYDCHTDVVPMLFEHGADVFVEGENGNTCLHLITKCDDEVLMKMFIDRGLDVNKTNKAGETPLQMAIEEGKMKVMKMLLELGGDPNTVTQFGRTCLVRAIEENDDELAAKLLEQNVDVNVQLDNELTPLLVALGMTQGALAKLLISKGADVRIRRRSGTCLHLTIEQEVDLVEELLDAGLDVNQRDENGYTPLHIALKFNRVQYLSTLLNRGANPHLKSNDGYSCLHYAVEDHDETVIKLFLEKGVSIEDRTNRGNTPLLQALQKEKLDNAKLLLAYGASIVATNYKGNSCLYYAAKAGFNDLITEFIEKGEFVDKLNNACCTPFLAALRNSQAGTAKLLLEKGADVNARGYSNVSWLDYVVGLNDLELMDMMIQKGADVNYGFNSKYTVLLAALKDRKKELADFLIKRGADTRLIDLGSGDSCLHYAAKAGFDDLVDYFIGEGLDVNRVNNSKETPLRLAFAGKNLGAVKLLLSHGALTPPEGFSSSYLHCAAELGDDDVTLELIKRGLDLESKNDDGETSVFVALANNNLSTARLLLEKGCDVFSINGKGQNLLQYATEANADDITAILVEKGLVDDFC